MIRFTRYTILLICLFAAGSALSQKIDRQQTYEEEIIRYLGYEEVPVRYVSLPYDVTMSHNVERNFMDIGFSLLMFVPLIFLWRTRQTKWKVALGLILLFMWLVSLGSSHVLSSEGYKIFNSDGSMTDYAQSFDGNIIEQTVVEVYHFAGNLYAPIGEMLRIITDQGDHVTYLLLLAIIYLLYFLYAKNSTSKSSNYYLGALLLFYCFFMLILSAGIIWYGFLMFPLLYLEIAGYMRKSNFYKSTLLVVGGLFVLMAYFLKVSGLYFLSDSGIGMIKPPVLEYNFSDARGNEIYEGYYRNIGPALDQINSETESYVFQAGTALTYLVKKNNERVFKDGILNIMSQLVTKYKRKSKVNEALKASGFRYLIISPNLYVVDQTPEKSLTAKFQKLMGYLHQNAGLKLLATDRVVRKVNENGILYNDYDMFGEEGEQIVNNGTYAIYEIL